MEITSLIEAATTFRNAIISSKGVSNFPYGSCQLVSMMLARHLVEDYGVDQTAITYIIGLGKGKYGNGDVPGDHFWLEVEGVYVDITADQFPEISEAVNVTTEWIWKGRYLNDRLERILYAEKTLSDFHLMSYNVVIAQIKNLKTTG